MCQLQTFSMHHTYFFSECPKGMLRFVEEDQTICYFVVDQLLNADHGSFQCELRAQHSGYANLAVIPSQKAQDFIVSNRNALLGPQK